MTCGPEPLSEAHFCDTCGRRALFLNVISGHGEVHWCVTCARKEAWPFDLMVQMVAERGRELDLAEKIGIAISLDAAGRTRSEFDAAVARAIATARGRP